MAQTMKWLPAILNYMMNARLNVLTCLAKFPNSDRYSRFVEGSIFLTLISKKQPAIITAGCIARVPFHTLALDSNGS